MPVNAAFTAMEQFGHLFNSQDFCRVAYDSLRVGLEHQLPACGNFAAPYLLFVVAAVTNIAAKSRDGCLCYKRFAALLTNSVYCNIGTH